MSNKNFNKKTSELEIQIKSTKKSWKENQEKAFKELTSKLIVKGFRKGQVPIEVAKKNIHNQDIFAKALPKELDILVKETHKQLAKDDLILDSPSYKVNKISEQELDVTFVYPTFPEFKLPKLNLGVKFSVEKIDKKLIDDEIEKIRSHKAEFTDSKDSIKKGNVVTFDFEGLIDGKPFQGGKAEKYELEIGSGQFIPGFEDKMIGLKLNDEKNLELKFPKDYHAKEFKGKDVVFKVKIHKIKSKKLPELTDKFIETLNIPSVKNEKELRNYLEQVFETQYDMKARQQFQEEIFSKLKKDLKITIPTSILAKEMQRQRKLFEENLKKQKITTADYLKMTGLKEEQMIAQFRDQSEKILQDSFIFAKVAQDYNIKLEEKDYDIEYEKLSKVYGQSVENVKNTITKQQIQVPLTNSKVIEFLIKTNK